MRISIDERPVPICPACARKCISRNLRRISNASRLSRVKVSGVTKEKLAQIVALGNRETQEVTLSCKLCLMSSG